MGDSPDMFGNEPPPQGDDAALPSAAELEAATRAFAERLASGPTRAYGHMRRLMRGSFDRDLAGALQAE
ncbi:MAG: hypothetical protein WCY29_17850, partial [Novosphingobium sp.]